MLRAKIGVLKFIGAIITASAVAAAISASASPGVRNPGTVSIGNPQSYGRVLVLSDVHGHLSSISTLLRSARVIDAKQNWSAGRSLLLVVGDSVDKGPDSIGTLDLWIKLTAQARAAGGRLIHLLGNHEAEFLADPTKRHDDLDDDTVPLSQGDSFIDEIEAKGIDLATLTGTSSPRGAFLHSEPLAVSVGTWVFFHAGLFPTGLGWKDLTAQASAKLSAGQYGDPLFLDDHSMLEAKNWWSDPATRNAVEAQLSAQGFFGIVFGHQPKAFEIENKIGAIDQGRLIKIDSGMADSAGSNPGEILVFPKPAELNQPRFPTAFVIQADGQSRTLVPVNY